MRENCVDTIKNEGKLMIYEKSKYSRYYKTSYVILLFLANYSINGSIELKGLFMDDLLLWSKYHSVSALGFIFNTFADKFRPIAMFPMFVGFRLAKYRTDLLDVYLLLFNFIAAVIIFYIIYKIINNEHIACCMSVAYLLSRLAYYQIGQYFGIMESTGLIFAVLTLYFIYRYVKSNTDPRREFIIAIILFFLDILSHERYLSLIGIFFIAPLIKYADRKNKKELLLYEILSGLVILSILLFRFALLGAGSFSGTSGTLITDTFSEKQIITFFWYGIVQMLGVNAGEHYLTGIPLAAVSPVMHFVDAIYIISVIISAVFSFVLYRRRKDMRDLSFIQNNILFLCFIGLTLASASVTFRLEMRWLYTPFVGCLILFSYWISFIIKCDKKKIAAILLIVMIVTQIPLGFYYRNYYIGIYFSGAQATYNQLYTKTIRKYGEALYTRPIVLVENRPAYIVEGEVKNFYLQYKQNQNANNPEVYLYTNLIDITPNIAGRNPVVLLVDSKNLYDPQVMDITDEFANFKIKLVGVGTTLKTAEIVSGYSSDGWLDKSSEFKIKTGAEGKLILTGHYPKELIGNETGTIYIDGKAYPFKIEKADFTIELSATPNTIVDLKIVNDFSFPADPPDVRVFSFLLTDVVGK